MSIAQCEVTDCNILQALRTFPYCQKHLARYRKYGDPEYKKWANYEKKPTTYPYESLEHKSAWGSYQWMMNRCNNKKAVDYSYYGGRGIEICSRWGGPQGFENFLSDMGDRPPKMTLDRIDPNKGYTPENCRWATITQQARNRRRKSNTGIVGVRRIGKWYIAKLNYDNKCYLEKRSVSLTGAIMFRKLAEIEVDGKEALT